MTHDAHSFVSICVIPKDFKQACPSARAGVDELRREAAVALGMRPHLYKTGLCEADYGFGRQGALLHKALGCD